MKRALIMMCAIIIAAPAFAQVTQERMQLFLKTISIAGKIDAINQVCPPAETMRNTDKLIPQVMEGFALENGTEEQYRRLQQAGTQALEKKNNELRKRDEMDCQSSDFLWEKHALYEELLFNLRDISKARSTKGL